MIVIYNTHPTEDSWKRSEQAQDIRTTASAAPTASATPTASTLHIHTLQLVLVIISVTKPVTDISAVGLVLTVREMSRHSLNSDMQIK